MLAACTGAVGGTTATINDSRHQCRTHNWQLVGVADGIRGYDNVDARFAALEANCSQHGAIADKDLYLDGYAEGRKKAGGG